MRVPARAPFRSDFRRGNAPWWAAQGYTEADVRDGAGAPAGSYGLADGVTAGALSAVGSMTAYNGGAQTVITITRAADIAGHGLLDGGTGTEADPYLVSGVWFYQFRAANGDATAAFTWNHDAATYPAESYWIKFYDCHFGYNSANSQSNIAGDAYINAPATGGVIFENCTFGATLNPDPGRTLFVEAVRGTTRLDKCWWRLSASQGRIVTKSGAATVEIENMLIQHATPGTSMNNNVTLINLAAAGGSLSIDRMEVDTGKAATSLLYVAADVPVTINGLHWDSEDRGLYTSPAISTNSYQFAHWDSGLTITNSYFNATVATTGNRIIGSAGTATYRVRNITIDHCTFWANDGEQTSNYMIDLGDAAKAAGEFDGLAITWCRFRRPYADDTPGNEIMYLRKFDNLEIAYNWVDQCGEDAYELHQPGSNNRVHHCGGGDISGSYIGNNVVDIWSGSPGGTYTPPDTVEVSYIWGTCKGDAVVVDGVEDCYVHHIYTDNSGGPGPSSATTVANVRLHCGQQNGLDDVLVEEPLPTAAESYHGYPVLLEYNATSNTTASAGEPAGETVIALTSATGFLDGQHVAIVLDDDTYHDTTQVGAPSGNNITIADAIPTGRSVAIGAAVYTTTITNAGTMSWQRWNGSAFETATGTDGVVRLAG